MYIAKGILNDSDIKSIYHQLMNEPKWNIGGSSDPIYDFPRLIAFDTEGIYDPFLTGYFISTLGKIRDKIYDDYGFNIPDKLETIRFNAQKKGNIPSFHSDFDHKGTFSWSVVGFLTPQWDKTWGGELQIQDKTFLFEPGDFIVFKSSDYHDALPIKVDTPFWRVSVACMIR